MASHDPASAVKSGCGMSRSMLPGALAICCHAAVSRAAAALSAALIAGPWSAWYAAQNAVMSAASAGDSGSVPIRGVDWLLSANTCSAAPAGPP